MRALYLVTVAITAVGLVVLRQATDARTTLCAGAFSGWLAAMWGAVTFLRNPVPGEVEVELVEEKVGARRD